MRAARWLARGSVAVQELPIPTPADHEALIAVDWVGICGSDVEEYVAGPLQISPPVTLGHEIVGRVAAAAADGSGPAVGTPVVVDVVTGCGRCFWCRRHEEGLCPELRVSGQHVDGGLAEYMTARAERLIAIPPELDPRDAALAEPLSVAVRAVRKAGALQGRSLLVIGGGAVGMLTAQVARAAGANPVLVIEPDDSRRVLIDSWAIGVTSLWEPDEASRCQLVARLAPERGVDVVVESSGQQGMTAEAIRTARRGGAVILLSVLPAAEAVDTIDVVLGEKVILGSAAHMWDDDVAVAVAMLASGAVRVDGMITSESALHEVSDAFELLSRPGHGQIKMLVNVASQGTER